MRWVVHGERPVYESPWVSLALVDVEVPGGERFEHHVVRMPAISELPELIRRGGIQDGCSLTALLWFHQFAPNQSET